MNLTKSETNNAIIIRLNNVRKHPNADRLKLATVLGTTVVVGLEAQDGDLVVYFDSNLRLSDGYLKACNLYSNMNLNADTTKKGYFGSNGRVRAQKFRGEMSNGYVAELWTLNLPEMGFTYDGELVDKLKCGDEFTHINGVEVCRKYVIPHNMPGQPGSRNRTRRQKRPASPMFKPHWDTKQLMRCLSYIQNDAIVYIEEKIHGTSGRTGLVLTDTFRPWYKPWIPRQKWMTLSGTRRMDHIGSHMPEEREEIRKSLEGKLHKGETVYYEIFGYTKNGSMVQSGFPYGCVPGQYKVMLYRVTITTPDGFTFDLPRETVYRRAEELGMVSPVLIEKLDLIDPAIDLEFVVGQHVHGNSALANHMKEGIVVWYQQTDGTWTCLKHKSDEFYLNEDALKEKNVGDVEDSL